MHQDLKKLSLTQQNENTCSPLWKGIPAELQPIILNFLTPMEALQCITTSKDNIQNLGPYIINRLRHEKITYKMIIPSTYHTLAMRHDGTIFAWGYNSNGQLGLGHTIDQNTPQRIPQEYFQGKTIQSIQIGSEHNLVLCSDGTLFAWGRNSSGQLGLGHNDDQNTPKLIDSNQFQGKTIQSIHTGGSHTLARCTDDTLFAWGKNNKGQLGLGHNDDQNTLQLIDSNHFQGKTIQSIHTGNYYTLVRCSDNSIFAWGYNEFGQLGLGHTNNQHTPQLIEPNHFQGKTIQSIHTGGSHTRARCTDGTVFAWGLNHCGQLGLGHTNNQNTPQLVDPDHFQGKTIQTIHTGQGHILARCTDGTLFSWGMNGSGQLGIRHTNDQYSPHLIDSDHFQDKTIRSGGHHSLALGTDGSLFAWGANNCGQLGLGHNDIQLIPTQLPDPLERTFRTGHQRLNSTSFFSNTAVNPNTRFLSGCVFSPNETDQSRTESTTTGMGK